MKYWRNTINNKRKTQRVYKNFIRLLGKRRQREKWRSLYNKRTDMRFSCPNCGKADFIANLEVVVFVGGQETQGIIHLRDIDQWGFRSTEKNAYCPRCNEEIVI